MALNRGIRQIFTDQGFDTTEASRAAYALGVYILGSLALEVARPDEELPPGRRDTATSEPAASNTPERHLTAPDGFPHGTPRDQYLWGLRKLLDGLSPSGAA